MCRSLYLDRLPLGLALVMGGTIAMVGGASAQPLAPQANDSAAVTSVVHAFHQALSGGDGDTALGYLAEDVLVLESGGLENREEYQSHHLPGDMAFASAVERISTLATVQVVGDVAWVVATSTTQGTFRDREINSRGAELMVLRREGDTWRIVAIHWSSRRGG